MLKYNKFVNVNEVKNSKINEEIKEVIDELFNKCPIVSKSNNKWPTEKCLYSLSGINKYVHDKVSGLKNNSKIYNFFHNYALVDKKVKSVFIKNYEYDNSYPYYYNPDKVSKEEVDKKKKEYEQYSKEQNSSKSKKKN